MDVCRADVPPEVTFGDRLRVACHRYPPGSDGAPRPLPRIRGAAPEAAP
jgi:hypothetical protein